MLQVLFKLSRQTFKGDVASSLISDDETEVIVILSNTNKLIIKGSNLSIIFKGYNQRLYKQRII